MDILLTILLNTRYSILQLLRKVKGVNSKSPTLTVRAGTALPLGEVQLEGIRRRYSVRLSTRGWETSEGDERWLEDAPVHKESRRASERAHSMPSVGLKRGWMPHSRAEGEWVGLRRKLGSGDHQARTGSVSVCVRWGCRDSGDEVDGGDADAVDGRLGVTDGPFEAAGEVLVEVVGH
jgi:hypothetical protein